MTGTKGSAAKKSAKQKDVPREKEVEQPVKDELETELDKMMDDSNQLFEGQNSWMHGDNLEVLRLKVASSIIDEFKHLETVIQTTGDANDANKQKKAGQTGMTSRPKEIEEEQTKLDKLVDELMYITKPEVTMWNKAGLASSMQQSNYYSDPSKSGQIVAHNSHSRENNGVLALHKGENNGVGSVLQVFNPQQQRRMGAILIDKIKKIPKPTWHAPWKLKRVSICNLGHSWSSRLGTVS